MPLSIYAFEDQFHDACKGRLRGGGATPAYSARDLEDLPGTRVVVEAAPFTRASGHMGPGPAGELRYDHFEGQVTFIITTPRTAPGRVRHGELLGLVRELFLPSRRPLDGLPYQIMRFEDTGGGVTYIQDGERDRSELVYTAEIGLRPGV